MTALYIILAVVAVIMLLLLIPADCILEFSYNNKENNGSVIIKYAFLKFKIFQVSFVCQSNLLYYTLPH